MPQSPYPPAAFSFKVIFGDGSDTSFQEVSGIGPEIETEDVVEGGENRYVHHLPKAIKHPKLVLKRGLAMVDAPLVQWCKRVLEGDFSQPLAPSQVDVRLLDEDGNPLATWTFADAFPVRWEVEGFNATRNEIAIEKIELRYTMSKREG